MKFVNTTQQNWNIITTKEVLWRKNYFDYYLIHFFGDNLNMKIVWKIKIIVKKTNILIRDK